MIRAGGRRVDRALPTGYRRRMPSPARALPGLVCLALLFHAPRLASEGTLLLREREAGKEKAVRESVRADAGGNVLVSSVEPGGTETAWVDSSFFARRMTVSDPLAGSQFTAVREGRAIRVVGRIRGRQVDRLQRIDASPWLCLVELSLGRYMAAEGAAPFAFWVLDSATGEPHKLSAQRVGRESLDTPAGPVDAVRVRFTIPGVSALFWNATWWFRAADGTFLRYEMPRGMPGTPKTVLELVAEQ